MVIQDEHHGEIHIFMMVKFEVDMPVKCDEGPEAFHSTALIHELA